MTTGPCLGGIIVTFSHWKIIYWVQVAMSGLGFVLSFIFIPSISQVDEKVRLPLNFKTIVEFNPWPTLKLLVYPNLSLVVCLITFAVVRYLTSLQAPCMRLFKLAAVLHTSLATAYYQSSVQFHLTPCVIPFLPCSWRRLLGRINSGREAVRLHSSEKNHSSEWATSSSRSAE